MNAKDKCQRCISFVNIHFFFNDNGIPNGIFVGNTITTVDQILKCENQKNTAASTYKMRVNPDPSRPASFSTPLEVEGRLIGVDFELYYITPVDLYHLRLKSDKFFIQTKITQQHTDTWILVLPISNSCYLTSHFCKILSTKVKWEFSIWIK